MACYPPWDRNRELMQYKGYRGVLSSVGFHSDLVQVIIRPWNGGFDERLGSREGLVSKFTKVEFCFV